MAVPAGYRLYAADVASFAVQIANSTVSQPIFSSPNAIIYVHLEPGGERLVNLYNRAGGSVDKITADESGLISFYAAPGLGTLWLQPLLPADSATPSQLFHPTSPADLADQVEKLAELVNNLISGA